MGGEADLLRVEVAYALPKSQLIVDLRVPCGITARAAVVASGLDQVYPELELATVPIGVFGERVADEHVLETDDRVELYRPLLADPMEQRRQRASHAAKARALQKSKAKTQNQ